MVVTQLSVVVDNTPGQAAKVLGALASAKIDLRAVSIAENADLGIMRFVVKEVTKAKALLKKKGIAFTTGQVIAVVLRDKPGALAKMLAPLGRQKVNVEYIYGSTCACSVEGCENIIVLRVKNAKKATAALKRAGYKLIRP